MNIMLDAAKALDPETAPRSSVMVWVDANDPDCGLGFARFVTKKDRPRIISLLQAELESVIRAEALDREGDDELTARVLRETLEEEG